jgi:hypothetical protein
MKIAVSFIHATFYHRTILHRGYMIKKKYHTESTKVSYMVLNLKKVSIPLQKIEKFLGQPK